MLRKARGEIPETTRCEVPSVLGGGAVGQALLGGVLREERGGREEERERGDDPYAVAHGAVERAGDAGQDHDEAGRGDQRAAGPAGAQQQRRGEQQRPRVDSHVGQVAEAGDGLEDRRDALGEAARALGQPLGRADAVVVGHGDADKESEAFLEKVKERIPQAEFLFRHQIVASMAINTGPGLIGLLVLIDP